MNDADLDAQLSAYLAAELDDARTAALEQRLAADPALAARLDLLADALLELRGVDDAVPPGFDERLAARLAAEQPPVSALPPPVDLAAHRRARSAPWWAGVGAAAAALVAVTVIAAGALQGLGAGGSDQAAMDTAAGPEMDTTDAEEGVDQSSRAVAGDSGGAAAGDGATESAQDGDAVAESAPLTAGEAAPPAVDTQVVLTDVNAVRSRYADSPEVAPLLGLRLAAAAREAAARERTLRSAPPFASGASPAQCLTQVRTDAPGPVVVALVETAVFDGRPALVYVTATASEGAQALDRTEVWVFAAGNCATLAFAEG